MTKEDRKLLLKDLCARVPYGVYLHNKNGLVYRLWGITDTTHINDSYLIEVEEIKPYLRPMSSMTEEEAKEIAILHDIKDILSVKVTSDYIDVIVDDGVCSTERRTIWYDEIVSSIKCFDWLNAHHFDYRGLIEKGLAIEVTKENNPYEN